MFILRVRCWSKILLCEKQPFCKLLTMFQRTNQPILFSTSNSECIWAILHSGRNMKTKIWFILAVPAHYKTSVFQKKIPNIMCVCVLYGDLYCVSINIYRAENDNAMHFLTDIWCFYDDLQNNKFSQKRKHWKLTSCLIHRIFYAAAVYSFVCFYLLLCRRHTNYRGCVFVCANQKYFLWLLGLMYVPFKCCPIQEYNMWYEGLSKTTNHRFLSNICALPLIHKNKHQPLKHVRKEWLHYYRGECIFCTAL